MRRPPDDGRPRACVAQKKRVIIHSSEVCQGSDTTFAQHYTMIFSPQSLDGVFLIEIEKLADDRGFFARTFDCEDFKAHGLEPRFPQLSISHNARRGTLRGLHFQRAPCEENKIVRCTRGAIFDVVVDLRVDSPSCGLWLSFELSDENSRQVYIPKGCAHGFQTLTDNCDVQYQISAPYSPAHADGIRWDDAVIGIDWPAAEHRIISARDLALPAFRG